MPTKDVFRNNSFLKCLKGDYSSNMLEKCFDSIRSLYHIHLGISMLVQSTSEKINGYFSGTLQTKLNFFFLSSKGAVNMESAAISSKLWKNANVKVISSLPSSLPACLPISLS